MKLLMMKVRINSDLLTLYLPETIATNHSMNYLEITTGQYKGEYEIVDRGIYLEDDLKEYNNVSVAEEKLHYYIVVEPKQKIEEWGSSH